MPAYRSTVTEAVAEKLKNLPGKPGCYIFKNEAGDVLYVGKALVLKNRVRSYFQASTRHGARIGRMVSKVRDFEWIVVDSELEALVLECNLIKKHRPPYNVRLRDDKSYPYIAITNEPFPRVIFTRRPRKDGSRYFGPYTSAFSVRDTLQLLHKVFPLIPCGKTWTGAPVQRPCLYHHLGQCLAPCAGMANAEEYKEVISNVRTFLEGREETLLAKLKGEMAEAAEHLDFERAAKLRDTVQSLESVLQRQKVLSGNEVDQDVIAVVKDERGAAVQMLYVRGGKLIGQRQFYLDGAGETPPGEAVQEFVKQYYSDAPDIPREVLLPVEIEERNIVQAWLRQRKGSAVNVEVPQGGDKMRLIDMAATNAEQALSILSQELAQKEAWAEQAMSQLQESLDLPSLPLRIEGYDISNIQGKAPVGSMVVTEIGEAAKDEYRRFKVRYHPESPNDFAMMHEVITRRLTAFLNGDEKFRKLPDLIMIDGGRGQLAAALKARDDLGLTVPMVGLAKRLELIIVPTPAGLQLVTDASQPAEDEMAGLKVGGKTLAEYRYERGSTVEYSYRDVELPLNSPGLLLLRKLRDEAHRFALSYHRKLRDKRLSGSLLEEIPGIGPRRRRLLLRTFGSIEAIRRASLEELAAIPTMTQKMALQVKGHLNEE
jgi:excinuclease ABC subunit C